MPQEWHGVHVSESKVEAPVRELYSLVTTRHLGGGEELTVDYATISGAPGQRVPCRCGAPACRGTVEI